MIAFNITRYTMFVRTKQQIPVYPILPYRTFSNHNDQLFLTKILAKRDPLLRELNGLASFVLDDHPYPKTKKQFDRRTQEIDRKIKHLRLSSSDQKFLDRLMMETGVNVVRIYPFYTKNKIFSFYRSIFGKDRI